jgi:uncharacterized protein (TIGR03083 family)
VTETQALFLDAVARTGPLLSEPALVERFDGPSALAEFSVRGLAGHLLRAVTSVEGYLDRPEPDAAGAANGPEAISAAEYYAAVIGDESDINSEVQRAVRQRGVEAAAGPPHEFSALWAGSAERLRTRLAAERPDRLLQVYGGLVLTLDEYLVTRLVELVVHGDDLAASLGVAPPPLPPAATGLVIATLVEVARIRHGDAAVVRALTRRERDSVEALRVI